MINKSKIQIFHLQIDHDAISLEYSWGVHSVLASLRAHGMDAVVYSHTFSQNILLNILCSRHILDAFQKIFKIPESFCNDISASTYDLDTKVPNIREVCSIGYDQSYYSVGRVSVSLSHQFLAD
ncbi:hypothetical protein BpHYR1_008217 [Brachionus plicatilis]|uniref:Uncharacterized protein n=1 Tax=Brachionus plicatilis TaxID=10195 RepID=A0A3M7PGU4_BRAPC|nr:hypothetical protein BpHYR1_008217 [Brachionus plicatilis]